MFRSNERASKNIVSVAWGCVRGRISSGFLGLGIQDRYIGENLKVPSTKRGIRSASSFLEIRVFYLGFSFHRRGTISRQGEVKAEGEIESTNQK